MTIVPYIKDTLDPLVLPLLNFLKPNDDSKVSISAKVKSFGRDFNLSINLSFLAKIHLFHSVALYSTLMKIFRLIFIQEYYSKADISILLFNLYFIRMFNERVKKTPLQYRKAHR